MDYLEAENNFIGCILKDGELIKETSLQPEKMACSENRIILDAARQLEKQGDPVDVATLVMTIGADKLQGIGGRKRLTELMNSVPSVATFKVYERYTLEGWKVRKANRLQGEIRSADGITDLKRELEALDEGNEDEEYDHREALVRLHDKIENQTDGLSGVDTGFRDLNNMTEGYQGGDLIICAARPSVGKTAKMLNVARKHGENGGVPAIFSLEMGEDILNTRMISAIGRIDGHKMRNPKRFFDDDDWSRYTTALGLYGNMNIHIYDKSGQTVSYIRSKCMALKRKYPDKQLLIMIDYLQLIRGEGRSESKNIEVGEISRSLKELARDTDSPVYLLSQLSRGVEQRQDKRPMMSDLRDSGSVEQDADVIEFLYRDDYYDKNSEKKNIIEVIIAKQRNGPVGTVELAYIKEYNLFLDLDHRYDT